MPGVGIELRRPQSPQETGGLIIRGGIQHAGRGGHHGVQLLRAGVLGRHAKGGQDRLPKFTAVNFSQYSKGHAQNIRREGDYLVADLHIEDAVLAQTKKRPARKNPLTG